ncbi:hypothetical protein MZM54_01385 [[Brevibacterium] frigoritolerans]|nr:hypothetical protein [Peribacillus frigoritolerans]
MATTVQEYDWNTLNEMNVIILFFALLAYGLINVISIGLHNAKALKPGPLVYSNPKASKQSNEESMLKLVKQTEGKVVKAKGVGLQAQTATKEVKEPTVKVDKINPDVASFKKDNVVSFEDYIRSDNRYKKK